MDKNREIVSHNENYGEIILNFKNVIDKSGLTPNKLSDISGIKYDTILRWYSASIVRLDIDVLAKLCYVLRCKVTDVIEYIEPVDEKESEQY